MERKRLSRAILLTFGITFCATFAYGRYTPKAAGELINHTHFALDYNEEHEQPNWVYYTLTSENIAGPAKRSNRFKSDPKVSTGSATTADYTGSGYDRGHLCPAADMSQSTTAMNETFYMSNMSPQAPSCNRGVWKNSEEFLRRLITEKSNRIDTLYVVTGPIFRDNRGAIGTNNVTVPGSYYKVAYSPQQSKMWAFVIPNEKSESPLDTFRTTVDRVEELIGVDLYYQLPRNLQQQLESKR